MQLAYAEGIRQVSHLAHPSNGRGQLAGIQLQAGHQGHRKSIRRRGLKILLIGRNDLGGMAL
jgi:hypothetical protein